MFDTVEDDDVSFDSDEEFDSSDLELGMYNSASHTEIAIPHAFALQEAKDRIERLTTNQFAKEAYVAATMLRNVLGDQDPLISDQAENIRSNLSVLIQQIYLDPGELVLEVVRALAIADPPRAHSIAHQAHQKISTWLSQTDTQGD